MLERLERRGAGLALERAAARRTAVAERIEAVVAGVAVQGEGEAVTVTGRGLARRYGRSAALRWAIAEACDER